MESGQACGPRGARRFSAWRLFSTLFRACPFATPLPRKFRSTTAHASRRQIFSAPRRAPHLPLAQVPVTGFVQIPVAGPAVIIVAVIAALLRSLRDAAVGASGLRVAGPGVCPFEPRAPRRQRCVAGGGRHSFKQNTHRRAGNCGRHRRQLPRNYPANAQQPPAPVDNIGASEDGAPGARPAAVWRSFLLLALCQFASRQSRTASLFTA